MRTYYTATILLALSFMAQPLPGQISWNKVVTTGPYPVSYQHQSFIFDDKLWISGGRFNETINQSLWSTPDGVSWTKVRDSADYPMRVGATFLSYKEKAWVMGGSEGC